MTYHLFNAPNVNHVLVQMCWRIVRYVIYHQVVTCVIADYRRWHTCNIRSLRVLCDQPLRHQPERMKDHLSTSMGFPVVRTDVALVDHTNTTSNSLVLRHSALFPASQIRRKQTFHLFSVLYWYCSRVCICIFINNLRTKKGCNIWHVCRHLSLTNWLHWS